MSLFILWVLCLFLTLHAKLPQVQTNALIDFYNCTTQGTKWIDSYNWLISDPCINSWRGVVCDRGNSSVVRLNLMSNQLSGTIPSTIGSLSALQYLELNDNQLSGTIPSTIVSLSALQYLNLMSNQLSGTIPSTIGSLSALQYLNLMSNQLSGTIPSTIVSLSALQNLYLYTNQLSGTIPSTIGSLSALQDLLLDSNQLSGTIPSTIVSLSALQNLDLRLNQLSGTIPSTIVSLSALQTLLLSSNNFCGGCLSFSLAKNLINCDIQGILFNCSCPDIDKGPCYPRCNHSKVCQVPTPTPIPIPIPTPAPNPTPTLYIWIIYIVLSIISLISITTFVYSYICPFLRGYDPIPSSTLKLQNPIDTLPDVLNGPLFNRYVFNCDEIETKDFSEPRQEVLASIILLQKNEQPCSFKESIAIAYGVDFNELFVDKNIENGNKIYSSLCLSEKYFNMTLEEVLAIYFFTLEWFDPTLNLYYRLNRDLTSKYNKVSATKWRFYLHFMFEGLRKIPYWKGSQDLYRAVSLDLISKYPQTYVQGNEITWFGATSTTTNLKSVKEFIHNKTSGFTIFSINSTFSGRSISKFSSIPNECEVLLPPGSCFKILGILPILIENNPVYIIQLKQIPTLEKLRLED